MRANEEITCTETEGAIYTDERVIQVAMKEPNAPMEYTLRLFRIGDIMFQGIDAEIVTSIGQAVMETSPYDNTILVTLANGYKGYCADEWEAEHEAFEWNANAIPGEWQKDFTETFTEMFSEIDE